MYVNSKILLLQHNGMMKFLKTMFYKILDKANKQYRPLFHRYNALKKKVLGLKEMYNYDLNVPLVEGVEKKYTIDQCFEIIEDVVKVFGDDYVNIIKQARQERWIDFHPTRWYIVRCCSSGRYDDSELWFMNFIGDYNFLSTMIHELGHSCHTYLSSKNQDPANSDYRIFVAEVASTVNETLASSTLCLSMQKMNMRKLISFMSSWRTVPS